MKLSIEITSIDQISKTAKWLLSNLNEAKVIAFYGQMGVGKTTLIKELCKQLGCNSNITSPTFAIVNEYESDHSELIYHFDFYRLNDIKELIDIGFNDYIESGNYCFMEWPEISESLLPENTLKIKIELIENQSRRISIL